MNGVASAAPIFLFVNGNRENSNYYWLYQTITTITMKNDENMYPGAKIFQGALVNKNWTQKI